MQLLATLATSIRNNSQKALRPFVAACLPLLTVLALPWAVANGQTTTFVPYFPKYEVLGVVYAPPGSNSNVTYGNSQMVGASNSIQQNFNQSYNESVSVTAEAGFFGFGSASAGGTESYGWTNQTSQTNTVAIQTTTGNAVATAGPVSSALGVNHDNDIIYILLNPVVATSTTGLTSSGFVWNGIQANSCDLTDTEFLANGYNVYQAVGGCDPNQYPFPDIVGIPVWCLKNPYNPSPSCSQWLPYTSRSWDTTPWGNDPLTNLPLALL